jgi:hypothetical protein
MNPATIASLALEVAAQVGLAAYAGPGMAFAEAICRATLRSIGVDVRED